MDIKMPVLDGFEATLQIRRAESGEKRTPIIAMSAHVLPEDESRCYDVGMDAHIAKPVQLDKLEAVLDRWCPRGEEG